MLDDTGIQQLQLQLNRAQEPKRTLQGAVGRVLQLPHFLYRNMQYWPLLASLSVPPNLGFVQPQAPLTPPTPFCIAANFTQLDCSGAGRSLS
jgi:hypothetical protein